MSKESTVNTTTNWVLATGNQGKVAELQGLLAPLNINIQPQSHFQVPNVAETGTTFVENAIIKARHASHHCQLPAIADDSGIEVDALSGKPGVYSARYAGENASDRDNIHKLLVAMAGLPEAQRTARFHCVLVLMRFGDDPTPVIAHGSWEGRITSTITGSGGFGYDPIFWVPEQNCTAAQLNKDTKNRLSHRGKALSALLQQLQAVQP